MSVPEAGLPAVLDTDEAVAAFFGDLPGGLSCALDTEADSLYSYTEKLCLIQVCVAGDSVLVDPLSARNLAPLHRFLRDSVLWLHGADYDMTMWWRTFGYLPERIFDTQVAARLLGRQALGLAAVVREVLGVELSKSSQKANWGRRPLPDEMRRYAADDVRYLLPLAQRLCPALEERGRHGWFVESCEAARRDVLNRPARSEDEAWRIPGWGRLRPRALAHLRALWHWRDGIAEKWDRPPFKVLGNDKLLEFAGRLAEGETVEPSVKFPEYLRQRFRQAVAAAAALPEADLPRRLPVLRMEKSEDWEGVYDRLKAQRDAVAARLELDPSILAPRSALERYAYGVERGEELKDSLFLGWQKTLLFGENDTALPDEPAGCSAAPAPRVE